MKKRKTELESQLNDDIKMVGTFIKNLRMNMKFEMRLIKKSLMKSQLLSIMDSNYRHVCLPIRAITNGNTQQLQILEKQCESWKDSIQAIT